jgi:hypothetical protein
MGLRRYICTGFLFAIAVVAPATPAQAQNEFEKRRLSRVTVSVPGLDPQSRQVREYADVVTETVGPVYSTPRIRDAIQELYSYARMIHTITVLAETDARGDVEITFNVRMKTQASRVSIEVADSVGDDVTEQELLLKLNILTAGSVVTEQILRDNAD